MLLCLSSTPVSALSSGASSAKSNDARRWKEFWVRKHLRWRVVPVPGRLWCHCNADTIGVCAAALENQQCSVSTGYLLREIQKANIAVPEEDESPLAPPPRQVLEIMVSARF